MSSTITIRQIRAEDIPAVKLVIWTVAYGIFGWDGTLEDSIREMVRQGELEDVDRVDTEYLQDGGQFFVALDDGLVIGSGAVRRMRADTAEVKRLWLLDRYQGRGIGYRIMQELIAFAHASGYTRLVLQTSPQQTRALAFYRKIGFQEIASYNDEIDEVSMELRLIGTNSPHRAS